MIVEYRIHSLYSTSTTLAQHWTPWARCLPGSSPWRWTRPKIFSAGPASSVGPYTIHIEPTKTPRPTVPGPPLSPASSGPAQSHPRPLRGKRSAVSSRADRSRSTERSSSRWLVDRCAPRRAHLGDGSRVFRESAASPAALTSPAVFLFSSISLPPTPSTHWGIHSAAIDKNKWSLE